MARRILIDPVTRIEGHAKISIYLDDAGEVIDARFHVAEFRGFEKFCEGRPLGEMAGITARVCGICPVSHLLASAKAGDDIFAVDVPPAADKLRRLMNLGQITQSHALSLFHLGSPDLLLGYDSDPAQRNLFGVMAERPDLARGGIRLRQFGQEVIELLGGKRIHPAWAVPGGVREPLTAENRDYLRSRLPEAFATAELALAFFKTYLDARPEEVDHFGNFPTLFMGLVTRDGGMWEHYDGSLRIIDSEGRALVDGFDPRRYAEILGEAVEPWSYLKSPYYRPLGDVDGAYRVGPLARLNLCSGMGTPRADAELADFRKWGNARGIVVSSFLYHYARLIEIVAALERIERLLGDPEILSEHLRARGGVNRLHGVGVSEAPRGTLFHDYQVDEGGILRRVNLIIATGQNNIAMNRTIQQIARHWIHGAMDGIPEGMLNRVEAGIRAYDPCLSCSTHAFGKMPLLVRLFDAKGRMVGEVGRD